MEAPDHVYTAAINASPSDVWDAIVNPEKTVQYFFGTVVESDWKVGSPITYREPDGTVVSTGEIISIDPPHTLEMTFHPKWDPELDAEGPVREVWRVAPAGDGVTITIELFDAPEGSKTLTDFVTGFPYIVGGLSSLVEADA